MIYLLMVCGLLLATVNVPAVDHLSPLYLYLLYALEGLAVSCTLGWMAGGVDDSGERLVLLMMALLISTMAVLWPEAYFRPEAGKDQPLDGLTWLLLQTALCGSGFGVALWLKRRR